MEIVVQCIEDCPNRELALARLREALTRLGTQGADVRCVEVRDAGADDARGFRGSPTVLIDGRDPFPGDDAAATLSCRRYVTEHGAEGAPSVHQLVEALGA